MASDSDDEASEGVVGYGRPPTRHQFKKGTSGNPKGRPKGTQNLKTDLIQMLNMPVPIERNGRQRKISTQKASLLRLREKALKGDMKALERLLELAKQFNGEATATATRDLLASEDQAIIDAFLVRHRAGVKPTSPADGTDSTKPREKK